MAVYLLVSYFRLFQECAKNAVCNSHTRSIMAYMWQNNSAFLTYEAVYW